MDSDDKGVCTGSTRNRTHQDDMRPHWKVWTFLEPSWMHVQWGRNHPVWGARRKPSKSPCWIGSGVCDSSTRFSRFLARFWLWPHRRRCIQCRLTGGHHSEGRRVIEQGRRRTMGSLGFPAGTTWVKPSKLKLMLWIRKNCTTSYLTRNWPEYTQHLIAFKRKP
jgi:hypothetical protein